MGVLLQGFFFGPGRIAGVPSPVDGNAAIKFWWIHLANQANALARAGFTAVWLPPPLKGASGGFSDGYDQFDDYDLGSKDQKGTIPTRYGPREDLELCCAALCANNIDVYADLVENQRDGDDGHFNFVYRNAFGNPSGGRFEKGPGDFHPNVPQDPGVFSDQFEFGRDLAPINGVPRGHCRDGLMNAANWLTRALDIRGYRLDNMKGVSTFFINDLLNQGAVAGKFAVGEFADGNLSLIQNWENATNHRCAAFDFPLHFALKQMCNDPGSFDMAALDHAGLTGADPLGTVTFVENADTDRGGIGGPVIRNKELAYAYILTSEGYPCVFYRDYSTDPNCFGLKSRIDPLIAIHEIIATGPTQQRWKDGGVFAYERLGGPHLLVALNKDTISRTITVATGFPARTVLHDFSGHAGNVSTQGNSAVTITIPANNNGNGYVCYSLPRTLEIPARPARQTVQVYEGADDLDLKPAINGQSVDVCRILAAAGTHIEIDLAIDMSRWTASTTLRLQVLAPDQAVLASVPLTKNNSNSGTLKANVSAAGFHKISLQATGLTAAHGQQGYRASVRYTAPESPNL